MARYEPSAYWEKLLVDQFDERAVGYANLARSINRAMYRAMERSTERALQATHVASGPRRVLDIGSGVGIWIDFWRRRGATDIAGVDLTSASVEHLRDRWPEHDFLQADVGDPNTSLRPDNDLVSAMAVLLHIVDEDRFKQAFVNLAEALRPGGTLVLIEPIVVHNWWGPPFGGDANSKARPLADYRSALQAAHLELMLVRPVTVLLANVVDTRTELGFRVLRAYWELLTRAVGTHERLGTAASAVLERADRLATRLARTGPSAKVLIAQRAC